MFLDSSEVATSGLSAVCVARSSACGRPIDEQRMGLCTSRPVVRDEDDLLNDGFKPHSAAVLGGQDCVNAAGAHQQIQGVSDAVPHPGYAQDAQLSSGPVAGSGCTTAPEPSAARSSAAMILEVSMFH